MASTGSSDFGRFGSEVVFDSVTVGVGDEVDADLSSLRTDVSVAANLAAICFAVCDGRLTRVGITIASFTGPILRLVLASNICAGCWNRWVDPFGRDCANQDKKSCNLKMDPFS